MANRPKPEQAPTNNSSPGAVGWLGVLGLFVLVGFVLYRIYPGGGVPEKGDPGWLDNIFDSNLVIFAARLVLLSAGIVLAFFAAHMVWSVVRWFKSGQLLSKLGPIHVSEHAVETLQVEMDYWRTQALELNEQVHALTETLRESEDLLGSLLDDDEIELDEEPELGEDSEHDRREEG